jgi:DNA mismatch repair protein MutL
MEQTTTSCRIRVLPEPLVNKIAAGEVIERPASVVKELVDNAIDAGARRIAVTVEEGGRRLIRVTDDGGGLSGEELRLAVQAHATSKLDTEDDLYAIRTLGFRGEALASVSAIAKLRMVSRQPGSDEGNEIVVAGRELQTARAAGCPPGTTVEVRDLFFNVPARRRFLRTPATEIGHIHDVISRAALAHTSVGWELSHNGRTTLNMAGGGERKDRISGLYGPELASALMTVSRAEQGVELEAYLAPPAQARGTTQWQYVFVNHRPIRDRHIQHAVRESYRGLLEANRHPVVFLFLSVDPSFIDVNVHPTKVEVRWADSGLIHSQVYSALRETLQRSDLTPALRTGYAGRPPISIVEQDRIRGEVASLLKSATPLVGGAVDESLGPPGSLTHPHDGTPDFAGPGGGHAPRDRPPGGGAWSPRSADTQLDAWRRLHEPVDHPLGLEGTTAPGDGCSPSDTPRTGPPALNYGSPRVGPEDRAAGAVPRVVQMHNLYLVAESEDGILIIDQHALHERIMFERLRSRMEQGPLPSQRLLLPETIPVTRRQADVLDSSAELLARLGIEATPFGEDAVAVHAFPTLLQGTDVRAFMRDLLDELAQRDGSVPVEAMIHRVLDMMACKAAVKAGDTLTAEEIHALLQAKDAVERSSNCPHGRPTMLKLTKADLDRQFRRT